MTSNILYIDPKTRKSLNPHAPYTATVFETREIVDPESETSYFEQFQTQVIYPNLLNSEVREILGIETIQEPPAPADYHPDYYYRTEQEDAPYVIYTAKPAEQIAQVENAKILQKIKEVEATVTDRRIREAIATDDNSFILAVNAEIAILRSQLK